jgi:virginiamycin B lyase
MSLRTGGVGWGAFIVLGAASASMMIPPPSTGAETSRFPRWPLESLPIIARISVPNAPDWLAMGFGSVWVVNYRPASVVRIDPSTNRVLTAIPLAGDGCLGIAIAWGMVWVPDCTNHTVVKIDPVTNAIAQLIPVDFHADDEGAFAISDSSLWLFATDSLASAAMLLRVDPNGGRVLARIPVGPGSYVAGADSGALWVSSTHGATIVRVDPGTNTVVSRTPVPVRPKFLTVGRGGVWVLHQQTGSVTHIDSRSGQVVATIAAGVPTPWGDISTGAGAVWVSVNGVPVTRIDPASNTVTHQFAGGSGADAIRFGFASLWVSDHEHGEVWRIDPAKIVRLPSAGPR